MINVIIDHDSDQIIINGKDEFNGKINLFISCQNMTMTKLQNIIYELLNLLSLNDEVNLYRRNEGRDSLKDSW